MSSRFHRRVIYSKNEPWYLIFLIMPQPGKGGSHLRFVVVVYEKKRLFQSHWKANRVKFACLLWLTGGLGEFVSRSTSTLELSLPIRMHTFKFTLKHKLRDFCHWQTMRCIDFQIVRFKGTKTPAYFYVQKIVDIYWLGWVTYPGSRRRSNYRCTDSDRVTSVSAV